MIKVISRLLVFGCAAFFSVQVQSQEATSTPEVIDTIIITSSRINADFQNVPMSVTVLASEERQPYLSLNSLQEQINEVPGLISFNAGNYAQDLRVSIRGFGARAAFGIRGIKLIVDGIPETTPDGQGQLDNLSLQDIAKIQVIRGGASSLYGNASGGVLDISTLDPIEKMPLSFGIRRGSFETGQYQARGGFGGDGWSGLVSVGHQHSDGFRQHSSLKQTNVLSKLKFELSPVSLLNVQLSYMDSPLSQDPGGVNIETIQLDRKLARDRNITFDAGEEISHWKAGISYKLQLKESLALSSYAFISGRSFDGRLPFANGGAIDLNRVYGGQGTQLELTQIGTTSINKLSIGYDIALQSDDRLRFVNNQGARGDQTLDQLEKFNSIGVYILDHFAIDDWKIHGGLRFDYNLLEAEDMFLSNGDDSGSISLTSLNPSLGISRMIGESSAAFLNYSTSFETPTLTELTANPSGQGGFNNELKPQSADHYEVGWRQTVGARTKYEVSLYHIASTDESIPYELQDFPGRTFFRNAGNTERTGIEMSSDIQFSNRLSSRVVYSYAQVEFSDFEIEGDNLEGNRIPGLPDHQASLSLNYKTDRFYARFQANHLGSIYLNNANTVKTSSSTISALQLGAHINTSSLSITPSLALNNLFDVDYFDNLRSNAFGRRYYEAGAGRFVQLGVTVQLK